MVGLAFIHFSRSMWKASLYTVWLLSLCYDLNLSLPESISVQRLV